MKAEVLGLRASMVVLLDMRSLQTFLMIKGEKRIEGKMQVMQSKGSPFIGALLLYRDSAPYCMSGRVMLESGWVIQLQGRSYISEGTTNSPI